MVFAVFFLYSFVESLDINILEDDDYVDNQMTAFGELLTNPEKMQVGTFCSSFEVDVFQRRYSLAD